MGRVAVPLAIALQGLKIGSRRDLPDDGGERGLGGIQGCPLQPYETRRAHRRGAFKSNDLEPTVSLDCMARHNSCQMTLAYRAEHGCDGVSLSAHNGRRPRSSKCLFNHAPRGVAR